MRNNRRSRNIFETNYSFEDNDLNININAEHEGDALEDEDGVALDTSDTPEAAELDIQDAAEEVEGPAEQVEEVADATEALESIYLALQELEYSGESLTPQAARFMNIAVDHAMRPFGGTAADVGVASMEDFEFSPTSALTASMEGIGDSIKKGFDAIVKFFTDLCKRIADFFRNLFDGVKAAQGKADKINAKLTTGKVTTKDKVKVPGMFGGEYPQVAELTKCVRTVTTVDGYARSVAQGVLKVMKADAGVLDELMKLSEKIANINEAVSDYVNIEVSSEPGKLSIKTKKEEGKATDVAVPALERVKAVLGENIKVLNTLATYRKGADQRKKDYDVVRKEIAKAIDGIDEQTMMQRLKQRRAASRMLSNLAAVENKIVARVLSVANATNNVVAGSFTSSK